MLPLGGSLALALLIEIVPVVIKFISFIIFLLSFSIINYNTIYYDTVYNMNKNNLAEARAKAKRI